MLIGEILMQSGALTQAQLDEALEAQVLHGGRIGTNLVELGHVQEEQLARALGSQHRVVCAFGEIVPSADALGLVDPNLCDEKDILPARVEGHKLYLLVLDPDDIEARDQVAVTSGLRVMPVVVAEFRMAQLLRRYCKAFRPVREVDLAAIRKKREADRAAKESQQAAGDLMGEDEFASLYADAMSGKSATPGQEVLEEALIVEDVVQGQLLPLEPEPEPVHAPAPLPPTPVAVQHPEPDNAWVQPRQPVGPPIHVAPPVQPPLAVAGPRQGLPPPVEDDRRGDRRSGPSAPPADLERRRKDRRGAAPVDPTPISFADAQKALATITDREDIARIVLRFAAGKFRRAMLLTIQRDTAIGWLGAGQLLAPNAARKVALTLKTQSTFKLVRDSRSHFLGPLRRDMATVMFLKALGEGGEPRTALLMPLLAAGRVVNILYVDQGPNQFTPPDIGELLILAQKVGRSFEAMLMAAKRKGSRAR